MKIQLKRSSVLDDGAAKQPTSEQMEYGELAVNYNVTDPSIFIKGSDNTIIKIAGEGAAGGDQTLQEVCSNGSSTTTVLEVNRSNDQGQAFIAKANGVLKYVVGSDGGVAIATDSNGLNPQIALKADGTASFSGNTDIGGTLDVTGNVAIATDKILLNADGTSTFTGNSTFSGTLAVGSGAADGDNQGVDIEPSGSISATQTIGTNTVFAGYTEGTSTATTTITAAGVATFGGALTSASLATAGLATIATYDLASLTALPEVS